MDLAEMAKDLKKVRESQIRMEMTLATLKDDKKQRRKWWRIGGGVLFLVLLTALSSVWVVAQDSSQIEQNTRDIKVLQKGP